jgi:hypothetical protein
VPRRSRPEDPIEKRGKGRPVWQALRQRARTLGSRRPKNGATTCANSSSNATAHLAGSSTSTVGGTATANRLVSTHPHDHSGGRLMCRPRSDRDLQVRLEY